MIRQSKTTLKELTAQYRSILKKCALLNAMALVSVAVAAPAGASEVPFLAENGQKLSGTYSGYINTNNTLAGVATINYNTTGVSIADGTIFEGNATKESAGGAIKALNGFTGGNGIEFNGNEAFEGAWGGGAMYIKLANGPTVFSPTDTVQLGKKGKFIGNKSNVGGAIALEYGNLTIGEGTIFDSNTATNGDKQRGGAIAVWHDNNDGPTEEHSTLTLNGVSFKNNQAGSLGGAIFNEDPNATVTINENSSFENNTATKGGAIYNEGALTVENATFGGEAEGAANTADAGGAIFIDTGVRAVETNITNSKFIKNSAASYGGAIDHRTGTLNITGSEFTGNHADVQGGAILLRLQPTLAEMHITDSTFTGNTASEDGAAISAFANMTITNTDFTNNAVGNGGGAILVGSESVSTITGNGTKGVFSGNTSQTRGGAIATRDKTQGDNIKAKLDISNVKFTGNSAVEDGGAFYNDFFNSATNEGFTTVAGSTFENNTANRGGAIFNDDVDIAGHTAALKVEDTNFTGNTATTAGGAIFNKGTLNFTGTNIFSGNKANGVLNDIYNDGILNISGNLTLDGGISSASGTGIVNFMDGALLTATLDKTFISGMEVNFKGNNTINMLVENTAEVGDHDFIDTTEPVSGYKNVTINNDLYNMTLNNKGKVNVAVKSGEELLADTPASLQEANTISALVATAGEGTVKGNAIANQISTLMQTGQKDAAVKLAEEVAPTTSQTVMGVAEGINSVLSNVAGARMAAVGRSGGDTFVGGSVWAQGLMNHTKQNTTDNNAGFSANTAGVSFGIDGKITNDLMIGVGYGYTNTNADSGSRDIDVDGHNIFAYTEYRPNNWYINGMFSYGINKYEETKIANLGAKYDVNTYAANVMTGYDFDSGVTPEIGVRYLLADQKSYNDGLQNISADNNDVLTGVAGFKYKADMKASNWTFAPNLRLAATYDMISDDSIANVSVIGGGNYQITGKSLERLGVEAGIGLETTYKDWTLSINYNGGFRKDFQSHTGMLKAKYNF